MTFDAFHLPHLDAADVAQWQNIPLDGTDHVLRSPLLTPQGITHIARHAKANGAHLRARPVTEIIDVIDRATAALRDDAVAYTQLTEMVAASTGYSQAMTAYVLERMMADWTADALHGLVAAEFGGPSPLDGFATLGARRLHATPPDLSLHLFSGNVPGVAITSIIRALLVKAPILGKPAASERVLAAAFARALAVIDADIGGAVAIVYWPGGSQDLEAAAFAEADLLVHYGGAEAIADTRRRAPAHLAVREHGPRISFGIVASEALADATRVDALAKDVAMAVATFDQQGCVSPHLLYVEAGGTIGPLAFAERVAAALHRVDHELPRGPLPPADATAIRAARDSAEFRGIGGLGVQLVSDIPHSSTVIYDPTPAFTPSCLNRTLTIHPVLSVEEIPSLVHPFRDVLQSVAVAADTARIEKLAPVLARAGVTRITTFEQLPWPSPTWHHDGRGPLVELIRWVDLDA